MTREELIAAMQADGAGTPVKVDIPRWGAVYVRLPTVAEVDAIKEDIPEEVADKHQLARSAARLICDENGKRLFDHANPADIELLSTRRWSDLQLILAAGRDAGN